MPPQSRTPASSGNRATRRTTHQVLPRARSRNAGTAKRKKSRRTSVGPPALLGRVGAVDEEPRPGGHESPAGAIGIAGLPALAPEHRVGERPARERRQNKHKDGHHEEREQGAPGAGEEVAAQPAGRLRSAEAAHRSVSMTLRLYQFMSAETARLMTRNTPMTIAMTSIARPDWLSTVPAKICTISG